MESSAFPPTSSVNLDFGFAFNDSNFSDRVLRIEMLAHDSPEIHSGGDACLSISNWSRYRKRPWEDSNKKNGENQDKKEVGTIEESPSGDKTANCDDLNSDMDSSRILRIKTLHISSPILAAKSPFFYKLFSNGTRESEQRHVTLRITASEEAALTELLNFMYRNTLTATTAPVLLGVLMVADKFEVASCMRYCENLLLNLPMTSESALLYLELPYCVLMAEAVQRLVDAAKQFLASRYKDISKFPNEFMKLSIAGVEAILSSDDLQVASEDILYDYVSMWASLHYPKPDERQAIFGSRLSQYIRFPYLTCRKLEKGLSCDDFDQATASKYVLEALFFKAEAPHRQRILAAKATHRRFVERAYALRPVKVVEFEHPHRQCVVYLDLKQEECSNLYPSGAVHSKAFHLGGQGFSLAAQCNTDQQSAINCFGLFLVMQGGSGTFAVEHEFAARMKPTEEYISKYKGNYTFTVGQAFGHRNLFGVPWTSFMAKDSNFFIDGVLHLRAKLTMRQ